MSGTLPPLKALHTFEVAARFLSFSRAAEELYVTQGAVSKQIRLLEGFLGRTLFERSPSGLQLTAAGRDYLPEVSAALERIRRVTAKVQQSADNSNNLRLNLIPSFSNLWLIPHLADLHRALPEVNLTQSTGDGPYGFEMDGADMAIRCLPLSRSIPDAELLLAETLIPVIHPARLQRHPIETAAQLLDHPLLIHTTRPQLWSSFITSLELVDAGEAEFRHGFEHFYMLVEAACQQQGIALVPDFMAREALLAGDLVNPLNIRYASGYGFYFLVPAHKARRPLIQKFRDWLKISLNEGH